MTAKLRSVEFRRERESSWRELDALLVRIDRSGLSGIRQDELARLPVLYRAAASSLSVARAISTDRNLLDYLESLVGRAYVHVYGTRRRFLESLGDFFRRAFPRAVRAHAAAVGLSAFFFFLGVLVAWVLTARDPEMFYAFVSEGMAQGRGPEATTEHLRSTLYDTEGEGGWLFAFATFLFQHNSMVGMLAFALGFLAGVPVFLLLFFNGLVLGSFAAVFASRGLGVELWGWILPHGVTELTAIILCGAAGLVLGGSLVFPGRYRRRVGLARSGVAAGTIVGGAVAMLLVAGLVEGIFRQRVTDDVLRYLVAMASLALWATYFLFAGREWR
jgi:uncharacterized membrane protein SpoIIM required for sporulation